MIVEHRSPYVPGIHLPKREMWEALAVSVLAERNKQKRADLIKFALRNLPHQKGDQLDKFLKGIKSG